MSLDALAVTKWSTKVLELLQDAHVYKLMTNQDYEGEVKMAGAVRIFTPGEMTVSNYARDDSVTYSRVTPGQQILQIDNRKYWAIKADNLEKHVAQGGGAMWEAELKRGAWKLADAVDDFIGSAMQTDTPSANVLSPRVLGLGLNSPAYDLIVDLRTLLMQNNVPPDDIHIACPPQLIGLLSKDDRFAGFNTAQAERVTIRGEHMLQVAGLTLHESNNCVVSGSTYTIQAASRIAFTYAEQLNDMQTFDQLQTSFDQAARQELVFGGKTIQPQGLAYCKVTFAV